MWVMDDNPLSSTHELGDELVRLPPGGMATRRGICRLHHEPYIEERIGMEDPL